MSLFNTKVHALEEDLAGLRKNEFMSSKCHLFSPSKCVMYKKRMKNSEYCEFSFKICYMHKNMI